MNETPLASKAGNAPRQKFRKIPVVIEAEQYVVGQPLPGGVCKSGVFLCPLRPPHVHTMHNNQHVLLKDGDWVIPEPDGVHFYPCDAEVFAKTYEKVILSEQGSSEHASSVSSENPAPPSSTELEEIAREAAHILRYDTKSQWSEDYFTHIILAALTKASSLKPKTLEETKDLE